jgi:hypothetical protein
MNNAYVPSAKAKELYQGHLDIVRIKGAGYGDNIFKTDPRFVGMSMESCICYVLDHPDVLAQFEQSHLGYTVANSSANTLFKLWKEGKHVDASRYGKEIEDLFNRKKNAHLRKQAVETTA